MDAGLHTTGLIADHWAAAASIQGACTILDTGLGQGQMLGYLANAWQVAVKRPRLLHYVALLPTGTTDVSIGALDSAVHRGALNSLDDGFHRIVLDQLQISLTLCIGEPMGLLSELRLQADHVLAGTGCGAWDKWWIKALTRCCRRGTQLHFCNGTRAQVEVLQECGFSYETPLTSSSAPYAVYSPRWQIKNSRQNAASPALNVGRCAVIGAGLCGSSVAQALALRGWQVDVYDQHALPAAGASGLPAGLVVPHTSADDSPRSQLSRRGTRLMFAHAERLLVQGTQWQQSGVLEYLGSATTSPVLTTRLHRNAGWIKPAQIVKAWLAHSGITFTGGALVSSMERVGGQWLLQDPDGQSLGHADAVVLANAHGCSALVQSLNLALALDDDLLAKLAALQTMHGTVSTGKHTHAIDSPQPTGEPAALPLIPVNGNGYYLPQVPGEHARHWYAGATYETEAARISDVATQHRHNANRLLQLLPDAGRRLMPAFAQGAVQHWSNTRCVTHDRMPLVGPVETGSAPTVWICAGMGSRGLSFAALCAQLLVAQMGAEPWPVEASLARGLHVNRVRRNRT